MIKIFSSWLRDREPLVTIQKLDSTNNDFLPCDNNYHSLHLNEFINQDTGIKSIESNCDKNEYHIMTIR